STRKVANVYKRLFDKLQLKSNKSSKQSYNLEVANAAYIKTGLRIKGLFKLSLKNKFKAGIEQLDFLNNPVQAKDKINNFVQRATHGMIKTILDEDPSRDTALILINAVYFKALWTKAFENTATKMEDSEETCGA